MQKIAITFLSFSLLAATVTLAQADDKYYVELGKAPSEEEAAKNWQALNERHKDILGSLEFVPASVPDSKNNVQYRVQAGPISSKKDAQALCEKLFKQETACFVIEGLKKQKPAPAVAAASDGNDAPMPWKGVSSKIDAKEAKKDTGPKEIVISSIDDKEPREEKSSKGFFSSLFGSDDEAEDAPVQEVKVEEPAPITPVAAPEEKKTEEKKEAINEEKKEAKVEVAEAISVPLTDNKTAAAQEIKTVKAIKPVQPLMEKPVIAAPKKSEQPGWLIVESFVSEDTAEGFWQHVRTSVPNLAAGLRVSVVRPVVVGSSPRVTLNVGPFASRDDALSFCASGIKPSNDALDCRFDVTEPDSKSQLVASRNNDHGDRYAARRQRLSARHGGEDTADVASLAPSAAKSVWIEVASGKSEVEALEYWQAIQEAHNDLVSGLRSSVFRSAKGKKHVVRLGPLDDKAQAVSLCDELKKREVACRVYSSM